MRKSIYDNSYTVNKPFCNITTIHTGSGDYRKGHYVYYTGLVLIYADSKLATFDYYRYGRVYSRTISGVNCSDRSLAIRAGKFAREIEAKFNS